MPRNDNRRFAAEVTVDRNYQLYIGGPTRKRLGVGYNDEVRVELPEAGIGSGSVTVSGEVNMAGRINVESEIVNQLMEEGDGRSKRTEAIIEATGRFWEGDSLTENRWDGYDHLEFRPLD